jgi:hypothetical protein
MSVAPLSGPFGFFGFSGLFGLIETLADVTIDFYT